MRLLLDTHVLLWWLAGDRISAGAEAAIRDPANDAAVSVATVWEMSIKRALGKVDVPDDLLPTLEAGGIDVLPVEAGHAWAAGQLPRHHDDPFDRLIVATALAEGRTVVTRDQRLAGYGVPVLPA